MSLGSTWIVLLILSTDIPPCPVYDPYVGASIYAIAVSASIFTGIALVSSPGDATRNPPMFYVVATGMLDETVSITSSVMSSLSSDTPDSGKNGLHCLTKEKPSSLTQTNTGVLGSPVYEGVVELAGRMKFLLVTPEFSAEFCAGVRGVVSMRYSGFQPSCLSLCHSPQ